MGKLIAIDKLYMNKIPNSCKECPLTYLDTGDDAYFGAINRFHMDWWNAPYKGGQEE